MVAHLNDTALTVAHIVTCWPAPRLTVIAKARFDLAADAPTTPSRDKAMLAGDEALEGFPQQLRYASDLVPTKPKADVMLVGTDPARRGQQLIVGEHRFKGGGHAEVAPFAPLAHDAPARFAKLGTYDERWVKERWPWFPADFDAGYFNAAAPALQVPYLVGDEAIELIDVGPERTSLRSALPGWRVRCFLDELLGDDAQFRELRLQLDTLWIDASCHVLSVVWRGMADIADEDASQLSHIVWAQESLAQPQKSVLDYERATRIQKMAKQPATGDAKSSTVVNDNQPQDENVSEREKAALDELHDKLEGLGATAEMLALVRQADRMADAMSALNKTVDADPAAAEAMVAEAEDKLRARLKEAGHELPDEASKPPPSGREPAPWSRERVELAQQTGVSMANADLSGLDLSALDLCGCDFSGALFMGASLAQTRLHEADLHDATLTDVNLEGAMLESADLRSANLTGATAGEADFRRSNLTGALLDGAMLQKCQFDESRGNGASFRKADLSGASFRKAELVGARFVRAIVHDVNFEQANLHMATLRSARGDDVCFRRARLTNMRAGEGSLFSKADLSGAQADGSIWMNSNLEHAAAVGASFRRADLSRARLTGVDLSGSNCENADFTKSDLSMATLRGANFAGARFTGANLERSDGRNANFYEAELWKASLRGLQLEGAHLACSKLAEMEDV